MIELGWFMKRLSWLFPLLLVVLAASACRSYRIADWLTQSGEALFKDDFSDPGSGWARAVSPSGVMD